MPAIPCHFERQHARLDALLHAHLLDVAGADFASALQHLQSWHQAFCSSTSPSKTHACCPMCPRARAGRAGVPAGT